MRDADRFAGIVDQHVESSVMPDDRSDEIARRGLIAEIGLMVAGARQLGRHRATEIGGPAAMQRDRVAVARETAGDGGADARGRAGDEGDALRHRPSDASRVSSGRSTIMKCPLFGITTVRDPAMAAASGLALAAGVMRSPSPSTSTVGHFTCGRAREGVLVGVAGCKIGMDHAGLVA